MNESHNKHTFRHLDTGKIYCGSILGLCERYNLNPMAVLNLIGGHRNSVKRWIVYSSDISVKKDKVEYENEEDISYEVNTFEHANTRELYCGTLFGLCKQFNLNPFTVAKMIKKERKSVMGWSIPAHRPVKKPRVYTGWRSHQGRDTNIYTFVHKDGRLFTGERCEFYRKYNLDQGRVSNLIHGTRPIFKGWALQKEEKPNE